MNDLAKILTGNSILINRLASVLNENEIPTLVRDIQESGRVAGFGVPGDNNELYVKKEDEERAQTIIKEYNKGQDE